MGKKINEFGHIIKYGIGDRVRIWAIFKYPVGTVQNIVDVDSVPIKYVVKYTYEDTGIQYIEEFESPDLTLVKKSDLLNIRCSCGVDEVGHQIHEDWCQKRFKNRF